MVNETILKYLKENKGKYNLESLKRKILSQGYPASDFDEANALVEQKKNEAPPISVSSHPHQAGGFLWIKLAASLGILLFVISLVASLINFFWKEEFSNILAETPTLTSILLIFLGVVFILSCFYLYGFVRVGRYLPSKMMRFSSRFFLISSICLVSLYAFLIIFTLLSPPNVRTTMPLGGLSGSPWFFYLLGGIILLITLFAIILRYLFAISLIKSRKKIKFAMITGILDLILIISITLTFLFYIYSLFINPFALFFILFTPGLSTLLLVFFIGANVLSFVTFLFEILFLFSASKIYEL
jgi:hypothetical protein